MEEKVQDATTKVELLNGEIAFNKSLRATLEQFQAIQQSLDLVQRAATDDRLAEAVERFVEIVPKIASLPTSGATRVSGILEAKVSDLRDYVKKRLIDCWNHYIRIDSAESSIGIRPKADGMTFSSLSSRALVLIP